MTISGQLIEETEKRYAERTNIREDVRRKIKSGAILQADTPQRVEKRLKRLARARPMAEVVREAGVPSAAAAAPAPGPGLVDITLERILGKSDLLTINYLEFGLLVARSVGRIRIRASSGRIEGFGTGFMISPRLLLTNHHVLTDAGQASFSQVEFNFQDGLDGQPLPTVLFNLQADFFFITNPQLDYSLVAVKDGAGNQNRLSSFGWSRLIEEEGKVILGECLNIIQHPNGEPKQLALRENQLVDLLENFLHYQTDTAPGSSGSPVFNDQWEVVGLHHSGVPRRDAQGRFLTKDGTPWTPAMGEQKIDWIANEGVRISQIVRHIKSQNLSGEQRRLRNEIFEAIPPSPVPLALSSPRRLESSEERPDSLLAINEEGSAVWTIPLQVSIRLGQATTTKTNHVLAPVEPSRPVGPAVDNQDLREALAELEAARTRKYYDEVSDKRDCDAYYKGFDLSLKPTQFFKRLNELLKQTHNPALQYQPTKHVYPWVDLQSNLKLRSIYSQREFDPEEIIREDFRIDQERAARLRELFRAESAVSAERMAEELDILEASLPYNCEHVVPQSWFVKREPMRGDLHHLFACESGCNSFRGNTPYFDFPDFEEAIRDACGKRLQNKFEPTAGKGAVARATLYFLLRYPGEINRTAEEYKEDRLQILLTWHETHTVTEYEKHRNMAIFEKQGNRNSLIDFPGWAKKIDFRLGLG